MSHRLNIPATRLLCITNVPYCHERPRLLLASRWPGLSDPDNRSSTGGLGHLAVGLWADVRGYVHPPSGGVRGDRA